MREYRTILVLKSQQDLMCEIPDRQMHRQTQSQSRNLKKEESQKIVE